MNDPGRPSMSVASQDCLPLNLDCRPVASLPPFDVTPFQDGEFVASRYDVRPVGFREAKSLIVWGHYTGSLTKGRHTFGLFRGDRIVGAAVYGQPSGRGVANSLWEGGDEKNTLELLRLFVMDGTGRNAESWFMARCHRLLPPEVRMLVAYSAPAAGHYGGCYQGANWLYLGQSKSGQNYYYVDADGGYVNKRIPWQYGPRNNLPLTEAESAELLGLRRIAEPRKMVYVLPLDKKTRKLLKREVLAYPKPGMRRAEVAA